MKSTGPLSIALLAMALSGCNPGGPSAPAPGPKAAPPPAAAAEPWRIVSHDPAPSASALVWNGLLGVRLGPDGSGYEGETGADLPAFLIDHYQPAGEEKIEPVAHPFLVQLMFDGAPLVIAADGYRGELDLETGFTRFQYKAKAGAAAIEVECEVAISPGSKAVAQRWRLTPQAGGEIGLVVPIPDGVEVSKSRNEAVESGERGRLFLAVRTVVSPEVAESSWLQNPGRLAWRGLIEAGSTVQFERSATYERGVAPATYDEIANAARNAAKSPKADIEIEGPVEDQQAVRSFLHYLRTSTHPEGRMAVSPLGLSRSQYNGHVFWDADIWVFPALALVAPEVAKAIPDYRIRMAPAAADNFRSQGGKGDGLQYPWESSVTGREVAPGPSKKEIHITGSVLWSLTLASSLGLVDEARVADLAERADRFYRERSVPGRGGKLELRDVMSPDEHHVGDNDLYTNLLADWLRSDRLWSDAPAYALPRDDRSLLTYDRDPVRSYKQAAAVLAIYPLQYPEAETQAKVMMERFADKITRNGPAMSESIHAIIWARVGEVDRAYAAWHESWKPYCRPPFLLFSEKRAKDVSYFTTGAAGSLQSVVYGFLGFRIDSRKDPRAVWSKQLKGGRWLSIKPNLPKAWKKVTFRNFTVLGKRYTLIATHEGARVVPGE